MSVASALRIWDRYWYGPVAAVRPWLLRKGLLLTVAFDAWLNMLPHGSRYGAGDFNVAHFAWLDRLQGVPSPERYGAVVTLTGLLAWLTALSHASRLQHALLAALYTYSWSMSLLDSYQHHYLLSWFLVALIFFPPQTAAAVTSGPPPAPNDARPPPPPSAWAYCTVAVQCAIVYSYTALAKTEPAWLEGQALEHLRPERVAAAREWWEQHVGQGSSPTLGRWLGSSVVGVQILIALGYLLAPLRDRGGRAVQVALTLAGLAAVGFHLGAEALELQIEWFSYYMLLCAAVYFLPGRGLVAAARIATAPWQPWFTRDPERDSRPEKPRASIATLGLAAAGLVGLAGLAVDLPGVVPAGLIFGTWVVVHADRHAMRGELPQARLQIAAAALGALCLWVAVAGTDTRWDYYRKAGGSHRRLGEWAAACTAYRHANRYAPPGEDRLARQRQACARAPRTTGTGGER